MKKGMALALPAICLFFYSALSQNPKAEKKAAEEAAIKNIVDSQNYVFEAQSAIPMGGRTIQLSSGYDLKVSKDSIVAYLPYYGRAYSAPMNSSDNGIQFKSKDFEYNLAPAKKGGWDILIKPKDVNNNVRQLSLSISESGYGSLLVSSNQRQPISFYGYIRERKPKKK